MELYSLWSRLNSGIVLSFLAVLSTMLWQALQGLQLQHLFGRHSRRLSRCLAAIVDPYLTLTIAERNVDGGGSMSLSDAYKEAEAYLQRATREARGGVRHLKAEPHSDPDRLLLSMGDAEEITDEFRGATVTWQAAFAAPTSSRHRADHRGGGGGSRGRRLYQISFLERHRDLILGEYITHVRRQGRAIMVQNRERKLFTNFHDDWGGYWSHVMLDLPKTFATLAMDPAKKKEVMDDLDAFRNGKDYYKRVGKAWKRGYLLYGPPGTGKSTMIAAMANYLDYDVYDVELTSVRTNTDLRKLFTDTTSKSIIVIEDIDCSLDLTGKRKKKKKKLQKKEQAEDKDDEEDEDNSNDKDKEEDSKVTLSGVLNFIDGLWSACGSERIIVFTTNHVDKLDPALIRRGRMDKHIEMTYCCFEAFKFLAKVYLDVEDHPLFEVVASLLREVDMSPADVAENLTPKVPGVDADSCLAELVAALEKSKEDALAKKKAAGEVIDDGVG